MNTPQGFRNTMAPHQSYTSIERSNASNLPFLDICNMLDKLRLGPTIQPALHNYDLDAHNANSFHQLHSSDNDFAISERISSQVATRHSQIIRPILESLFPQAIINAKPSTWSAGSSDCQQYSQEYLRLLIYAATNNLAGVQGLVSLPMMFEYLRPMMLNSHSPEVHALVKVASFPSAGPMAETFFRCAIEAGDVQAVRALCCSTEIALNASDQVCVSDGTRYTAVERAAALHHLALTRFLVDIGVDVNKTHQNKRQRGAFVREERCGGPPCGALEWALHNCEQPTSLILDLVSALLQAGGSFSDECLPPFLKPGWVELLKLLTLTKIGEYHRSWNEKGIFHQAAHAMDQGTLLFVFQHMRSVNADFDHVYCPDPNYPSFTVWESPSHLRTIIDITAWRGDLTLLRILLQYGATLTVDTLTAAVRSRNIELVQALLALGADADRFSPTLFTTPYAEALRLQEHELVRLLENHNCTDRILEDDRFCATLAAASEIGDTELVEFLLNSASNKDPGILGYALTKAALGDQTAVAITLLRAGAVTHPSAWKDSFGDRDRYPVWSSLHPTCNFPCQNTDPLLSAVSNRNATLVRALLDHDVDIHSRYYNVSTNPVLEEAVKWGDQSLLKDLIYAIGNEPPRNAKSGSSVSIAVENGDLSTVRLLLNAHFELNSGYDYGRDRPLSAAIRTGDNKMIQLLLDYGADPACSEALLTAMDVSPAIFRLLIQEFRVRHPCVHGNFGPVLRIAIKNGQKDIVQSLLDNMPFGKGDICQPHHHRDKEPTEEENDLNAEMPQTALRQAFDPDGIITDGEWRNDYDPKPPQETLLLVAIATDQLDMVQLLIDRGANVNLPAKLGIKRTPLQKAAEVGSRAIIQLLLDYGAEINAAPAERGGGTALQLACAGGFIGIVELLLEHGADIAAPVSKVAGRSPIEGAAEHGRFDMVHFLIKLCPQSSSQMQSAMHLATKNGHSAIADVLESEMAKINSADSDAPSVQRPLCNVCHLSFSNSSARSRHMKTAHGGNTGRAGHICSVCSRRFRRKDTMERHKSSHQKSGYSQCPSCGNRFRKDYLAQHLTGCQRRHVEIIEVD